MTRAADIALLAFVSTALWVMATAAPSEAARAIRTRHTVAHECLEREVRAAGVTAGAAATARSVLDTVLLDVARQVPARINTADPEMARSILRAIDGTLTSRRFHVVIPTPSLLDTLTPSPPPAAGKRFLTSARRTSIHSAPTEPCHRMDCDTGSILYAAIGEALRLPIVVVEAPAHKFVRWQLTGRQAINWDTNAALEYSTDAFRKGRTLTYRTTITPAEESAGRFLSPLTRAQVLAYHHNIVADILEKRRRPAQAAAQYRAALAERPHDSLAANNLAWLLLDSPSLRSHDHAAEALQLARAATAILPRNRDYQDTLARACAANGRFDEAIAAEKRAYNKRSHLTRFRRRQAY